MPADPLPGTCCGMALSLREDASLTLVLFRLVRNIENLIHQLRIYEIFEHNKVAFHNRFRDQAMRIMKNYGFHILAMWEAQTEGRTEFVYLLEWEDEATMRDAWSRFLADEEWKEIKRITNTEHGDLVGEIEERVLHLTDYSPALPSADSQQ